MHTRKTAVRLIAGLLLASTLTIPTLAATGTVDTEGGTLRVRDQSGTHGQVLATLEDGTRVEVLSTAENGWYQISFGDLVGYVSSDYLTVDAQDAVAAVPSAAPLAEAEQTVQYARVTASALNVRTGPSTDYDKAGTLPAGSVVEILGQSDGWYQIESGYISGDYVILVDAAEAASSGKGQEIANYALTFVGYPYVYGGSSPSGFDCSGFTQYVYKQFGYGLNRTASAQLQNGTPVSMSELQPGDLVLFKRSGTGSSAASHVGIYIGNGQFVHASTSKVGVIVSDISSAYYTTGFVGGRRLV